MAKTIKFNLICDNKPIRTIEDLQENFSIEDVLGYYASGLLKQWLEVRGYTVQLEKVNAITSESNMDIIKELIEIFDVEIDDKKVEEGIYMLKYLDEQKKSYDSYVQEDIKVERVIFRYLSKFEQLKQDIINNPNDAAKIKAAIAEMATKYSPILRYNHRELFWQLIEVSPLAVMCLLMNEGTRYYYLDGEREPISLRKIFYDDGEAIDLDGASSNDKINSDRLVMYNEICRKIKGDGFGKSTFIESLGDNVLRTNKTTNKYWSDLTPKDKKYMIISIGRADYIRSIGKTGEDKGYEDVLGKFIIVDGIDYMSDDNDSKILYMEV